MLSIKFQNEVCQKGAIVLEKIKEYRDIRHDAFIYMVDLEQYPNTMPSFHHFLPAWPLDPLLQ